MRLFIAVDCPPPVKDMLSNAQDGLKKCGDLKAVEYENLHLTLKFLGEVSAAKAEDAKKALEEVEHPRFPVTLKGAGVFPNPGNAKVVWAGVDKGFDEFVELAKTVDSRLKTIGFPPESRFHPHVTLARVKGRLDRGRLNAFLASHSEALFGSYEVDSFHLMESRLTPKGPAYTRVLSLSLR